MNGDPGRKAEKKQAGSVNKRDRYSSMEVKKWKLQKTKMVENSKSR